MTGNFGLKDSKVKKLRWVWHVEGQGRKDSIQLTTYAPLQIYFGFMWGLNGP